MKIKKIAAVVLCVVLTLCMCFAGFFAVAENDTSQPDDLYSSIDSGEKDSSVQQSSSEVSSGSVLVEFASSSEYQNSSKEQSSSQNQSSSQLEISSLEQPSSKTEASSQKVETNQEESWQTQKPVKKNILSLSDIVKFLIVIPILLMVAAAVTLVLVNKKGWLEGVIERKRENNTKKH